MSYDPRIDEKIASAQPFAQPILTYIRETMHEAFPDIGETIKWGMPFFELEGRVFANMSAFKAHAAFGFWKGPKTGKEQEAMGQYGRLTSVDDLPAKAAFIAMIHEAATVAAAQSEPEPKKPPKAAIEEPADVTEALAASPAARAGFDGLPPGARREYLEWIVSAKQPKTRATRIEKLVAQSSEGKKLNWKYEGC